MSQEYISFIYIDAKGAISVQQVHSISENEAYLQGICLHSHDYKTFRKGRILEQLTDVDNSDERLRFYQENLPRISQSDLPPRYSSPDTMDVCFSGFPTSEKKELISLAEQHGAIVRKSVTKYLDFLCCGPNAGPSKVETARTQGAIALNKQQFIQMLETGELPID